MKFKNSVPEPANDDVKCSKSPNGKHSPQTYEGKDFEGNKIKYKACRHCKFTLR